MAGDWIKLHRKMLDSAVMRHGGLCHLWIYCLLRANWQPRSVLLSGTTRQVKLERGQFITGRRALHAALYPERDPEGNKIVRDAPPPAESTVWRWLQNLEAAGQVKITSEPSYSIVTVCNYSTYQDDEPDNAPTVNQTRTNHEPTMNQPCANHEPTVRTEEEGKKGRTEEGKKGRKTPAEFPPLPFSSPEFAAAWDEWLTYRKETGHTIKPTGAKSQFRQFTEWGESRAIAAIRHTIFKGWQGLVEPPPSNGRPQQGNLMDQILENGREFIRRGEAKHGPG